MNKIKCPNCMKRCKSEVGLKLHLRRDVCHKHMTGRPKVKHCERCIELEENGQSDPCDCCSCIASREGMYDD